MLNQKESEVLENIEKEREENFERLHSRELMNIGKNFTDKEQEDLCRVMSAEILERELKRRHGVAGKIVTDIVNIVENRNLSTLADYEEFIAQIKKAVKA